MKTHKPFIYAFGLLLLLIPAAWAQSLGTTNSLEGPAAGSDSVVLAANGAWTATANDAWLHLSAANQSGAGSTNVIFTFDANAGATRTGTLTIAGLMLNVTQAGSTYIAVTNVLALVHSGVSYGEALDSAGNVYMADTNFSAITKWVAVSNTVITLVSTGLNQPRGLALDSAGNIYIADTCNNAIKKWVAASKTLITLVSSGLSRPCGVALDGAGNVYIADSGNNVIKEWIAASNTVTTLVSSGLNNPCGMAVDGAGNVYIADAGNNAIKEWIAASNTVTTLLSSGLINPCGVAVDGAGNIYIGDSGNKMLKKWSVISNTFNTLATSGMGLPYGVAVDDAGDVYIADPANNAIGELPHAFLDPTAKTEPASAVSDSLPVVLPATVNLTGLFAPVTESPWLTFAGVTNGVVSFAFTANNFVDRTALIYLLGQIITVTQQGPPDYACLATNLLEGPAAGVDGVALAANGAWTASANAAWLHLSVANQSGSGCANLIFTFDANTGATRMGTLTIAGKSLNVTQAGSTYVAVTNVTTLFSSGLSSPSGVAVDGLGNVYVADRGNNAIKEWIAASNTIATLVSSGLNSPSGVALDGAGNVYIANYNGGSIMKWVAASNTVTTLVSSGLSGPSGVAVDGAGNVYIVSTLNSMIKEWAAASSTITLLEIWDLFRPGGVAVDGAGNVYIADTGHSAIKEWIVASNTVTTLVSSGLAQPLRMSLDSRANVYFADSGNNAIKEWVAVSNTVITLVSSGLSYPVGVAVDGAGNVYFSDELHNAIKELPHAFVDSTAKVETDAAGSDTLSVVLPATANLTKPFAPVSDSSWLTITGVTNGVVSFSFTANNSTTRTAHITLLGQSIAVTQIDVLPPFLTGCTILGNGSFHFCFTNNQGVSFSVWTSPDMTLPFTNWTLLGTLTNDGSGQFQFTDPAATNNSQNFYRVSSP